MTDTASALPLSPRVRRASGDAVGNWLRAHPFTTAVAAGILLASIVADRMLARPGTLRWDIGAGYETIVGAGHWWSPLTAAFIAVGPFGLLVSLLATVTLLGAAEQLMGTGKAALAFFAAAIVGPLVGVGIQSLGSGSHEFWARHVTEFVAVDPTIAVTGALMAASGFASALWRRRIRTITLLVVLVFMLYSGTPSDLYRLLAALLGLLLGRVLRREKHVIGWARSSAHEVRVQLSALVAITAIGPALAVFSPSRFGVLAPIGLLLRDSAPMAGSGLARCQAFDITAHCVRALTVERISAPGAVVVSVAPLVLLLLSAHALLHGRRFAVWLAASTNALLGVLSMLYFGLLPQSGLPHIVASAAPASWEETVSVITSAAVPIGVAIALITLRTRFPVRAPHGSVRRCVAIIAAAALSLSGLYVVASITARDSAFTSPVSLSELLSDVLDRFVPVSFLRPETIAYLPATTLERLLYYGIGPFFWAIVIVASLWPMRRAVLTDSAHVDERVRDLLMVGGGGSLSFMASWPGNSYWFDPQDGVAIAYRVRGRVALTLAGPFGALTATEGAIDRFAAFCDDHDWIPVFYSIDGSYSGKFRSMGWQTMTVAEETVVRPAAWQTTGKRWQDVRSSINRAERAGITATWTSYDLLPLSVTAQFAEISEEWIADKSLPEMGYTLGGVDELRDPAVALMIARDQNDRVHAVTSWLPTWRDGVVVGWTLDFMRRRPDSVNGIMEFLIAAAATRMQAEGIEFLSLSAAPLAQSSRPAEDAPAVVRLLAYLSAALEPVYGFQSLLTFKRKFQPELHPLLMAYHEPAALPAIGLALTRSYLPTLKMRQATRLIRPLRPRRARERADR